MAHTDTNLESVKEPAVSRELMEVQLVEPNHLTQEQTIILKTIYDRAKENTQSIFQNSNLDPVLQVTQTIAQIIKLLEYVQINQKTISGSSKKAVALELGKRLIQEFIQDDTIRTTLLVLYDKMAEPTLETMIDVSQVVNTKIKQATTSCLDWLCGTTSSKQ